MGFLSSITAHISSRVHLFNWYRGPLPGTKWPGSEVGHACAPSVEVTNEWNYTSTSPIYYFMACIDVYRHNFTFIFPKLYLSQSHISKLKSLDHVCVFFLYSPTDAQVKCLQNNFKLYIKITIYTAPTCFGALTLSSGSAILVFAKVRECIPLTQSTSEQCNVHTPTRTQ